MASDQKSRQISDVTTAAEGKLVWFSLALTDSSGRGADVLSMRRRRRGGVTAELDLRDADEHAGPRRRENAESTK